MKSFLLLALVSAACAAPKNSQNVEILQNEFKNDGHGSYGFTWELSDGTRRQEQGQLKNQGTENEAISVEGQYAWVSPDGITYVVNYVADENGFQPQIDEGPGGPISPAVIAALLGKNK